MSSSSAFKELLSLQETAVSERAFLSGAVNIMEESFPGALCTAAGLMESTAELSFIRSAPDFSFLNECAEKAFREKKKSIAKFPGNIYNKWVYAAPLEFGGVITGSAACACKKKNDPQIEKALEETGLLFQQFRLKHKLIRDTMLMNAVIASSRVSASKLSLEPLLGVILPQLKAYLGTGEVRLFVWEPDGCFSYNEKGDKKPFELPSEKSVIRYVKEKKRPMMFSRPFENSLFSGGTDSLGLGKKAAGIIAAPVVSGKDVSGVLYAVNTDVQRVFQGSDLVWVRNIAGEIGAVMERNRLYSDMKKLFYSSIEALIGAIECRDRYTHGHSRRVAIFSLIIARELGLDYDTVETLRLSGLLHDIGKIAVPESILMKNGKLSTEEMNIVMQHPARGVSMLEPVKEFGRLSPGIMHHHEKHDGSGYPDGLKGKDIPLEARIIAVTDAFDAMTSRRIYRDAASEAAALKEIERCGGSQFDPYITSVFVEVYREKYRTGTDA